METGLNLKEIKSRNLSSILYLLNNNSDLSRKDIAEKLSLTPAAVTKLCGDLISAGLIREVGEIDSQSKAGRKKIKLELRLDEYYAVCINAEVDKISVSLARLDGKLICLEELNAEADIDDIVNKALSIKNSSNVNREAIICTSVCVIGRIENSSFGLWDNNKIRSRAEERLGLPVIMENNIQAFALAELVFGKNASSTNTLFLKWGPGIASAIARDGKILSGDNYDVTEIGHYIINKNGKKCRCGRYGCLETEVSTMEIINELDGRYTLDEIIASKDLKFTSVIDTKIDLVALALTNTATILNPDKIILFGSLFNEKSVFYKLALQCKRYNNNFNKDTIALSELNGKISYIGAVALAAKKYFFDVKVNDMN